MCRGPDTFSKGVRAYPSVVREERTFRVDYEFWRAAW